MSLLIEFDLKATKTRAAAATNERNAAIADQAAAETPQNISVTSSVSV
jgi:hypothetical protein